MSIRTYSPSDMMACARLFQRIDEVFKEFEPTVAPTAENPLYIFSTETIIRHRDDDRSTIGRSARRIVVHIMMTGTETPRANRQVQDRIRRAVSPVDHDGVHVGSTGIGERTVERRRPTLVDR